MDKYTVNKQGVIVRKNTAGGRQQIVSEADLLFELQEQGQSFQEAKQTIFSFKEERKVQEVESFESIIERHQPFQNFKLYKSDTKELMTHEYEDNIEIIGTLKNFTASRMAEILPKEKDKYLSLVGNLRTTMNPKFPLKVSAEECMQICINHFEPSANMVATQMVDGDPHPAVVQGCEVVSLKKIPYIKKNVTLKHLNPFLAEFLGRVNYHKHMCAIIWAQFTGRNWIKLIYLYGREGREGKTSFMRMLGNLSQSTATLEDDSSRFAFFPIYGKSIIKINENEKTRLISSKTIKQITGGNTLSIEEKGKTAFAGRVKGLMIVDSNCELRINGNMFETHRLMYCEVKGHGVKKNELVDLNDYDKELASTPNEFLNYCRQCYEETTINNVLQDPEGYEMTLKSLEDSVQKFSFNILFKNVLAYKGLEIKEGHKMEKDSFLHTARKKSKEKEVGIDNYYENSFIQYLEQLGHKIQGNDIIGIGPIQATEHTRFTGKN